MKNFLDILLKDQTTGKNILWANDEHDKQARIQIADVYSIRPRHEKNREDQKLRTKTRAEIFTPPEVCKLQNDLIAEFDARDWQKFIDAKFLEITCGEAPYIVSRYNVVTGEAIPLAERVGLLDRKFHVIREYNQPVGQWCPLAIRAVQSCYGYEFQGDNLFLARRNVFDTVIEYFMQEFSRKVPEDFLSEVAEIISWNLWQMDGLTGAIPYAEPPKNPKQGTLDFYGEPTTPPENILCKIIDWRTRKLYEFKSLVPKGGRR